MEIRINLSKDEWESFKKWQRHLEYYGKVKSWELLPWHHRYNIAPVIERIAEQIPDIPKGENELF